MLSLPHLVSLSLPQCNCVSPIPCLSVPYLCSRCHLFISLRPPCYLSLLHFFRPPSDRSWQLPSGLFQALAHTQSPSLFSFHTFPLCLSPFSEFFPSCCLTPSTCLRVCVRVCLCVQIGSVSEAWPLQHRIWRKTKAKRESLLCFFPSPLSLPVHLVAYTREGISHCVSPECQPLSAHISYSFIMRCQAFLSLWLLILFAFGMLPQSCPTFHMSTCPSLFPLFPSFYIRLPGLPVIHFVK